MRGGNVGILISSVVRSMREEEIEIVIGNGGRESRGSRRSRGSKGREVSDVF